MSALRQFRLELGRLLQHRLTWLAVLITVLSPAVGLTVYRPLYSTNPDAYITTMQGKYLANPALAGGLIGAIAFALLTVWNMDRVRRCGMEELTHAVIPPLSAALIRLGALLCASMPAQALTMLAWLPYTAFKLGVVFDMGSYVLTYLIFMYGAIPLAILFASAAYQFTRRADASLMLFAAFAALSLTVWQEQWQLCWLNPSIFTVSDDFSNYRIFRSVAYMRLTWLAALSGLWLLSYLCVRQYGKGAAGSFLYNVRRVDRPALAVALAVCTAVLYTGQPFLDRSNAEMNYDFVYPLQYKETVTCESRYTDVRPDPKTGRLYGKAQFRLKNITGKEQDVRFLINPGYDIASVQANGTDAPFYVEEEQEINEKAFAVTVPAGPEIELVIDYGGFPQEWNISAGEQGGHEISGEYMCLENDVFAPSLYDTGYDPETFQNTADIALPARMTPVLFGQGSTERLRENEDGTTIWRLQSRNQRMIVYAGDYICETIPVESADLTVNFYYSRKHQPVMEAMNAAEMIRYTVEYCTEHIGPLSFYADGAFNLIERRSSGGGYAVDGASVADELDYTAENLSNGAKGGSAAQVTIHEIVHQWWGLGNMFDIEAENGAWSSEGLTCYTTYRIVKELYGEETARTNFVTSWQNEAENYYKNFYVRNPEYLDVLPEQYRAEISNNLRGVRQYNEMPLKLLKAEKLVGGEAAMDSILTGLFNRELNWEYPYLTYQEFLDACHLTEEDLNLEEAILL